jgi:hypothetical protein
VCKSEGIEIEPGRGGRLYDPATAPQLVRNASGRPSTRSGYVLLRRSMVARDVERSGDETRHLARGMPTPSMIDMEPSYRPFGSMPRIDS